MRTTIKDVARKTGLSITTVSLVLNGKANRVSEKNKQLILQTAKDLNYRPNQIAVGLVKKKTNTLGLIIPDISNIFFSELAKGIEIEGRRNNYNVIFCNTNDKHDLELEYINILADKAVDGIIFAMSAESYDEKAKKSFDTLLEYKIPTVVIDRFSDDINFSSVAIDHKQGAYIVTQHLISLGHRKIGCVTGPLGLKTCIDRFVGYRNALEQNEIKLNKSFIYEGDYHFQSGYEAAKTMIEQKVTAIFAFNDMMAYGVISGLRKNNIKIPDEMSIAGFDDIFFSEMLDIPLTTVRQPTYEMGQEAARVIIEEIKNGRKQSQHIVFEPKLQIRKSAKPI